MLQKIAISIFVVSCAWWIASSADAATVAQWLLNEGSGSDGTPFFDTSGNGHHGEVTFQGTGFEWSTDSPFEPDESNYSVGGIKELRIPDAPELNPTGDFTIETWVKFDNPPGTNPYLVGKRGNGTTYTGYWLEATPAAGIFDFITGNGDGLGLSATSAELGTGPYAGITFQLGEWYHIAGVHTATENILYINGISNGGSSAQPMAPSDGDLGIAFAGGFDDKYGSYFSDDIRLSDVALDPNDLGYYGALVPLVNLGDFDDNNVVNGQDFLLWQRGGSPNPLSAADLAEWEGNYGVNYGVAAAISAVPEPGTSSLILGMLSLAMLRRSRTSFNSIRRVGSLENPPREEEPFV